MDSTEGNETNMTLISQFHSVLSQWSFTMNSTEGNDTNMTPSHVLDIEEEYAREIRVKMLQCAVIPLAVIGIALNMLAMWVWCADNEAKPQIFYFRALVVVDIIFCLTITLYWSLAQNDSFSGPEAREKAERQICRYIIDVCTYLFIYLRACISAHRFNGVFYPCTSQRRFSKQFVRQTVLYYVLFIVMLRILIIVMWLPGDISEADEAPLVYAAHMSVLQALPAFSQALLVAGLLYKISKIQTSTGFTPPPSRWSYARITVSLRLSKRNNGSIATRSKLTSKLDSKVTTPTSGSDYHYPGARVRRSTTDAEKTSENSVPSRFSPSSGPRFSQRQLTIAVTVIIAWLFFLYGTAVTVSVISRFCFVHYWTVSQTLVYLVGILIAASNPCLYYMTMPEFRTAFGGKLRDLQAVFETSSDGEEHVNTTAATLPDTPPETFFRRTFTSFRRTSVSSVTSLPARLAILARKSRKISTEPIAGSRIFRVSEAKPSVVPE